MSEPDAPDTADIPRPHLDRARALLSDVLALINEADALESEVVDKRMEAAQATDNLDLDDPGFDPWEVFGDVRSTLEGGEAVGESQMVEALEEWLAEQADADDAP